MFAWYMFRNDVNGDCTIDITDNPYLTPGMVFDARRRGDGKYQRQVAFYLEADANLIETSPIYHPPETEGG
jgi:hypothetical protein